MSCDPPCMPYMALYIISMHLIHTNSRSSTHWKLNLQSGKVQTVAAGGRVAVGGTARHTDDLADYHLFSILTSKVAMQNGEWKLESANVDSCSSDCRKVNLDVNKVKEDSDSRSASVSPSDTDSRFDRLFTQISVLTCVLLSKSLFIFCFAFQDDLKGMRTGWAQACVIQRPNTIPNVPKL